MWTADGWQDYALLDCGGGMRLERWGRELLSRPDPTAIWPPLPLREWREVGGRYERSSSGGGKWNISSLPERWTIGYGSLRFIIKPMGFKHTGIFPEQAVNWDWFSALIRSAGRPVSVLNLFGYTGGATLAAALAGAEVCHVDAARGIVAHGRENAAASGLSDAPIRWIVDDCAKFAARELRRGRKYDAVIMDPPSYGRGPDGEVWRIEENLYPLLSDCVSLLSDNPLFFLINSYTTGLSPSAAGYALSRALLPRFGGRVESGEIGLPVGSTGLVLPCGSSARWAKKEASV